MHTGILPEKLKIPPFLFLNFHLMGSPSYYHNDFKDSCVLKQNLQLGKTNLNLLCGLMSSQLHFFTICNFWGKFYKMDNLMEESYLQKDIHHLKKHITANCVLHQSRMIFISAGNLSSHGRVPSTLLYIEEKTGVRKLKEIGQQK